MVRFNDLEGLFKPKSFYDSMSLWQVWEIPMLQWWRMAAGRRDGNRNLKDPQSWSMPNIQQQLHTENDMAYVLGRSWRYFSSNLKQDRNILNSSKVVTSSLQENSGWPLRALGCWQAEEAGVIAALGLLDRCKPRSVLPGFSHLLQYHTNVAELL